MRSLPRELGVLVALVMVGLAPTVEAQGEPERDGAGRVHPSDGRRAFVHGVRFSVGSRVALFEPAAGRRRAHLVAVVEVVNAEPERVELRLGRTERVSRDAYAAPTDLALTADPWAPPRAGDLVHFRLGTRLLLGVSPDVAPGVAGSGSLRYRGYQGFTMLLEVDPLGAAPASGRDALVAPFFGWVGFGFDLPMFEVVAGAGMTTPGEADLGTYYTFAVVQRVRVGAVDGLNVELTAVEGITNRVSLQLLMARVEVPFEPFGLPDVWLHIRGGGGELGYGLGEVGARFGVWSAPSGATADLVLAAGAMGFFAPRDVDATLRVGPSLSAELEVRAR